MYLNPIAHTSKETLLMTLNCILLHFKSLIEAMLEIVVIDLDDEFILVPKTHKKVVTNVNYKFQEIWVVKVPWTKPIFNEVGVVFTMICHVCMRIERKEKNLVTKWDFIDKYVCKRKGSYGKWIMDPKCVHVKNEISYAQLSTTT
jgi:hypothetical protein